VVDWKTGASQQVPSALRSLQLSLPPGLRPAEGRSLTRSMRFYYAARARRFSRFWLGTISLPRCWSIPATPSPPKSQPPLPWRCHPGVVDSRPCRPRPAHKRSWPSGARCLAVSPLVSGDQLPGAQLPSQLRVALHRCQLPALRHRCSAAQAQRRVQLPFSICRRSAQVSRPHIRCSWST